MRENSYSKELFETALRFQENLDLARQRSLEGVRANIYIGYSYLTCMNKNNSPEKNEEVLTEGLKYYVTALNLAKELNLNDAKEKILEFLKKSGRDEQGNRIEESSVSIPSSSPKLF